MERRRAYGNSQSGQKGIYLSLKRGQGTGTDFSEKISTTSTYIHTTMDFYELWYYYYKEKVYFSNIHFENT